MSHLVVPPHGKWEKMLNRYSELLLVQLNLNLIFSLGEIYRQCPCCGINKPPTRTVEEIRDTKGNRVWLLFSKFNFLPFFFYCSWIVVVLCVNLRLNMFFFSLHTLDNGVIEGSVSHMMVMDEGRVYLTLIGLENAIDEGKLNYCKKATIASSAGHEKFFLKKIVISWINFWFVIQRIKKLLKDSCSSFNNIKNLIHEFWCQN